MAASSSRTQSNSSFYNNKPSSPFSSSSSSNSFKQSVNRSNGYGSRSDNLNNLNRTMSDSVYSSQGGGYGGGYGGGEYQSGDEIVDDVARPAGGAAGDSISVTIRFRPLSEREYQRGDEVAWYADGDKLVRNEYNPATSYAFDKVFGEYSETQEVYDVAAGPVIKAAMEGINGTVFAYGVTSSGKTHTMHGDHNSPGIIPLAIKDVFSIIQDTPGREFLLRVSYIEIYNEIEYLRGGEYQSGDEIVDDVARVYAPRFPQRKKMMAIRAVIESVVAVDGFSSDFVAAH